jgi:phosphate transport system protein
MLLCFAQPPREDDAAAKHCTEQRKEQSLRGRTHGPIVRSISPIIRSAVVFRRRRYLLFTFHSCFNAVASPIAHRVSVMRDAFGDSLDAIREDLVAMAQLVQTAVNRATAALLDADASVAEDVITADGQIDAMVQKLEDQSFELLSLQNPVAGDLRMLVSSLRIVSEFERMGDLAVHVAKIARLRIPDMAVPAEVVPTISRMAAIAEVMVAKVEFIIAHSDVKAAHELEDIDEEIDKLRRNSFRELLGSGWTAGVEPAVDVALLGRYYERIADHAVSIAKRVVFLVTGEGPIA